MAKFLITTETGVQTLVETDVSHAELCKQYNPSTDIHPVVEEVEQEAPKKKKGFW